MRSKLNLDREIPLKRTDANMYSGIFLEKPGFKGLENLAYIIRKNIIYNRQKYNLENDLLGT